MVLERAGRIEEAVAEYRSALEVYPNHVPTMQALTRCRLRHRSEGAGDDREIVSHLREVALRGESEEWREWARMRLVALEP